MIKPFCEWLAAQAGLTIGEDLFAGFIGQSAPDLCTGVFERTGAYVNPYFATLREVHYQLLTRGPDYQAACAEAQRVFDAAVNLRGVSLAAFAESGEPSWYICTSTGIAPAHIGQDEMSRFVFSANLTLHAEKEM